MTRNELAVVVALCTFAVFAPTLRYTFVFDDTTVIAANRNLRWDNSEALLAPFWATEAGNRVMAGNEHLGHMWRPAVTLLNMVDKSLPGGAIPFHITNVAIQVVAALLLYWLLLALFACMGLVDWQAAVLAVLWSCHPTHTDGVAAVVGRTDLFASMWMLGALLAYARGRPVWFMACTCLALGSKEGAVMLAPILLVLSWSRLVRRDWWYIGWAAGATVSFLAIRSWVIRDIPPLTGSPWIAALGMPAWTLHHLASLFIPWSYWTVWPYVTSSPALLSLEGILAAVLVAFAIGHRARLAGLAWFLLFSVPSGYAAAQVYVGFFDGIGKRFVGFASIGIVIYLADVWRGMTQRGWLAVGLASFAVLGTVEVVNTQESYRDPHTFWQEQSADHRSAMASYNFGLQLMGEGDLEGCVSSSRNSIDIDPGYFGGSAFLNLSTCELRLGRVSEAVVALREGLYHHPDNQAMARQLADIHLQPGAPQENTTPGQPGAFPGAPQGLDRAQSGPRL